MNLTRLAISVAAILFAAALLKFGNENYEALKQQGGLIVPIMCLLGGLVFGLYGIVAFFKSFSSK